MEKNINKNDINTDEPCKKKREEISTYEKEEERGWLTVCVCVCEW